MRSQKLNSKVKNFNTFKVLLVILTFAFCLLAFHLSKTNAVDMESSQYRIQMGNVNIGSASELESPTSHNLLSDTLGQLAANEFSSSGYIVKAGFQYLHSIVPFSFSISNININFGDVTANIPETGATNLTVSFGGGGLYSVTAIEENKMRSLDGLNEIPDTGCDGGANTCHEGLAKPWTSSTAYGFGYNMAGEDAPNDFIDSTYYRPFANLGQNDPPVRVMSNHNVTVDLSSKPKDILHQSTATFKLNVGPIQPAGTYQTIINFVATPSY